MKISIGILCALASLMARDGSAHEPVQGRAAARNAFPVPSTVRVVRDIVYAEYGARPLKLDLYLPPQSAQAPRIPGVVVVRGGGWRQGDKEAFGFIAGQLAKEGFAAASIEFRTSSEAKFPAAIHDVKAAVRWMRANARVYRINPDAIGAIGGSAGGHLVALLGTSGGVRDLEGSGGNPMTSSQVQAVVAMACVCNLNVGDGGGPVAEFIGTPLSAHADAIKAASPVTYVSRASPPRARRVNRPACVALRGAPGQGHAAPSAKRAPGRFSAAGSWRGPTSETLSRFETATVETTSLNRRFTGSASRAALRVFRRASRRASR